MKVEKQILEEGESPHQRREVQKKNWKNTRKSMMKKKNLHDVPIAMAQVNRGINSSTKGRV